MPTVPKLSYAKLGNKAKNKAEVNSVELNRQPGDDLFAQMNQDNLRYIQKEIKLKKNRSQHEKVHVYPAAEQTGNEAQEEARIDEYEQPTQGEEVWKQEGKIQNRQSGDYTAEEAEMDRRRAENLDREGGGGKRKTQNSKTQEYGMSQSVPYNQNFNRIISIQANFKEESSSVTNKEDGPNFIEFLNEYISDLHQSKQLGGKRSKPQKSFQSHNSKGLEESFEKGKGQYSKQERDSYETFSRPESRPEFASKPRPGLRQGEDFQGRGMNGTELMEELRKEKFNCIVLAREMEKLREQALSKDAMINKLQVEKQLLQEEIIHMKRTQQIRESSRVPPLQSHRPPSSSALYDRKTPHRAATDENILQQADNLNQFLSHTRHASVNPSLQRQQKGSFKESAFRQFENPNGFVRRQIAGRQASIDKLEREKLQFNKNHQDLCARSDWKLNRNDRRRYY